MDMPDQPKCCSMMMCKEKEILLSDSNRLVVSRDQSKS